MTEQVGLGASLHLGRNDQPLWQESAKRTHNEWVLQVPAAEAVTDALPVISAARRLRCQACSNAA